MNDGGADAHLAMVGNTIHEMASPDHLLIGNHLDKRWLCLDWDSWQLVPPLNKHITIKMIGSIKVIFDIKFFR
jgi:hypothetical protein